MHSLLLLVTVIRLEVVGLLDVEQLESVRDFRIHCIPLLEQGYQEAWYWRRG